MTIPHASAEKRVLIVSPHFPPVNAPDMQRVRMSLPYFGEFGWRPYVLAVAPAGEQSLDPLLNETIPSDVRIERVDAVSLKHSRPFGIGNVVLRSLRSLYCAGSRLIATEKIDLTYFSTTMFFSMPLGRVWRWRSGVPYVLDLQDPWLSDYYLRHPETEPPPKYALARGLHAVLEPWTMKRVGALIAVSDDYLNTLRSRYPWLTGDMCTTLPFGASSKDIELLEKYPQPNRFFQPHSGTVHGVYVGRGGDDMRPALHVLFDALREGIASAPATFGPVRLHFVGTDYATGVRARKTVEPVAQAAGVGEVVSECTERVPYFEALQLLKDAAFLVLIGSDDPAYTASKIYPYLMAGKPILAILHERSSLVPVLRQSRAATVITFSDVETITAVQECLAGWQGMMESLECQPTYEDNLVDRYSAREMARRQCIVFDQALAHG